MEPPNQNDDVGFFFDALDDFPFHDCIVTAQSAHSTSTSALSDHSPDSPLIGSDALVIDDPGKRRRKNRLKNYLDLKGNWRNLDGAESTRSISDRVGPRRADSSAVGGVGEEEKKEESMVTRANDDRFGDPVDSAGELDESTRRAYSSAVGGVGEEEKKEESTVTTAIDDRVGDSVGSAGELDESTNLLLFVAGLVIKAIGFQLNLLVYFVTFPLWILYCFYMLVVDPFGAIRRGRGFIVRKLVSLWNLVGGFFGSFIDDWLKEHKTIWSLLMQFGWGLFWSCYVCVILCGLLVFSVMLSGVLMRYLVEEPIKIRQDLIFDYTKDNPVAYVPIQSCGGVACCEENIGDFKSLNTRVIPPNHKLQVSVLLTMPESEYNRNLGVFQIRADFLSADGKTLASKSHPSILKFKSEPIRFLLTFLKAAPLVAGYISESQTLALKIKGFTERDVPTSCLKVIIGHRAEYRPGAGIPEIYDASIVLESELPLLKRIIWYWKKTIFIWICMVLFMMELLFALICCRSVIIPRAMLRDGSAINNSTPIDAPAQS
ncbi:hypothetical protein POPTR_011G072200v4 [Populus trichocarpa]|uniref:Uncharacterized protein n=1 Tax=Populus trichocarpa TaxID=3694 RepID=A0ACC0S8L3_POPTR|nr:seipin-2 [Populus trichocarpa]KAI5570909.1 hypothetical protein BDE02_11G059000 [Populus trichocarpa]KAI9385452.1 hypothetical protein POPTR_011G072200v4 [Populus trichocarpa]